MELHERTAVAAVRAGALELASGAVRAFDECLWCTQAAAPAWLRDTGLPLGAAAPRARGCSKRQGREQVVWCGRLHIPGAPRLRACANDRASPADNAQAPLRGVTERVFRSQAMWPQQLSEGGLFWGLHAAPLAWPCAALQRDAPGKRVCAGARADASGFALVGADLRSAGGPGNVFAVGDVAASLTDPRPKAGVFAVRQGPVLAANLRRRAALLRVARPDIPHVCSAEVWLTYHDCCSHVRFAWTRGSVRRDVKMVQDDASSSRLCTPTGACMPVRAGCCAGGRCSASARSAPTSASSPRATATRWPPRGPSALRCLPARLAARDKLRLLWHQRGRVDGRAPAPDAMCLASHAVQGAALVQTRARGSPPPGHGLEAGVAHAGPSARRRGAGRLAVAAQGPHRPRLDGRLRRRPAANGHGRSGRARPGRPRRRPRGGRGRGGAGTRGARRAGGGPHALRRLRREGAAGGRRRSCLLLVTSPANPVPAS